MFVKIFTQMLDSSIVETPEVRFTFMDMLLLCDVNGVVDMTHEAFARRTNRPIEIIRSTISELEKPDPRSRTPDAGGARLQRLDAHRDWGWFIVNYERFRKIASDEQRREKTAARVAKFKSKMNEENEAQLSFSNASVTHANASVTHANASNAMQKQKQNEEAEAEEDVNVKASRAFFKRSAPTVNSKPLKDVTDSEWLESLKQSKAYEGINVEREFHKAHQWISAKRGRRFTRKFFTNWLNRVEPEINVPQVGKQKKGF